VMKKEQEKKVRKIRELFVQQLARIQGGKGRPPGVPPKPQCPEVTTLACGEEPGCSGC
jgi:hypothetical protein